MLDLVLPDLPFVAGDEVVALVSGLGATPVMELYILFGHLQEMLLEGGVHIHRAYVGSSITSRHSSSPRPDPLSTRELRRDLATVNSSESMNRAAAAP